MTEQPPVTPTDTGTQTTTTGTEDQAQGTAGEVQQQTPLTPAEHVTYAKALYDQPGFVVDSVFQSGKLDPKAGPYTQAQVETAINEMMAEPDKSFDVPEVQP